eukprot:COSAG01_NODE_1709_length_9424_cov_50.603968_6_plen_87_part_00
MAILRGAAAVVAQAAPMGADEEAAAEEDETAASQVAAGRGKRREALKVAVVGTYMPPNTRARRAKRPLAPTLASAAAGPVLRRRVE